jgi:hypothetical protein
MAQTGTEKKKTGRLMTSRSLSVSVKELTLCHENHLTGRQLITVLSYNSHHRQSEGISAVVSTQVPANKVSVLKFATFVKAYNLSLCNFT